MGTCEHAITEVWVERDEDVIRRGLSCKVCGAVRRNDWGRDQGWSTAVHRLHQQT